jgi:Fic family protein
MALNRQQGREADFDVKKYIKASNEIEGIYSEKENAQSLAAWAFLDEQPLLSHAIICRLQKLITINQTDLAPNARGYYRGMAGNNVNVTVGGRLAPDHSYIEQLMIDWLNDVPEMTPLTGHIRFESIHPFVDGNGRTGRMLYWYVCKRRGIKPYYYNADEPKNREAYYRLFDHERVIKLSNLKWRFRDEDLIAKKGKS